MLLTEKDIQTLENQGYQRESFSRIDESGYAKLRNRKRHCTFYNPEKRECTVYELRPEGCRVYPVILDEEKGIVADVICTARDSVSEREKVELGKVVVRLLDVIDAEAEKRRQS